MEQSPLLSRQYHLPPTVNGASDARDVRVHVPRTVIELGSALYLISMMFALGLRVGGEPKESKEQKRRKRRLLVEGLVLNLVVIPLLAFGITRALRFSSDVETALLLLVASPGGRYAPHFAQLGRGDVALAAEVTIFLTKLTGFTAAPIAKFMLDLKALELREWPLIAQLLVLQLVPFYGGKWLGRKRLPSAESWRTWAFRFSIAMALFVLAFALTRERGIVHMVRDRAWLAVLGVSLIAPILGWLLGGRADDARRTLAIGTNASELALALVMANQVFPVQGVHTALFAVWSVRGLASFFLAIGLRRLSGLGGRPSPHARGKHAEAAR